jgi:hypothetical protein
MRTKLVLGAWCALVALAIPITVAAEEGQGKSELRGRYDRGFRLETTDGRFALRLYSAIQLRYTFVDYDERVVGNEENYSNFYLRRARLWWQGHAFDPRFTYYFHIQLEPTRTVNAHDVWLEYAFSDLCRLGVGRNKVAYGLEFLNSGFGLSFVERSVFSGETDIDQGAALGDGPKYPGGGTARFANSFQLDNGFSTGGMGLYRSQGLQLQGKKGSENGPTFEYQLGVWNGRGTMGLSNRNDDHLFVLRAGYHPWGWIDWTKQGDGTSSERLKVGLLISAYTQSSDKGGGFTEQGYDLAFQSRYRGISFDVEWAVESFDYDLFADDFEREAWRAQVGTFIVPGKTEVLARYAQIQRLKDPSYQKAVDSGLGVVTITSEEGAINALEDTISELSAGVAFYISEWHQHKLLFDLSRLCRSFAADPDAVIGGEPAPIGRVDTQKDWRLRSMVQLRF